MLVDMLKYTDTERFLEAMVIDQRPEGRGTSTMKINLVFDKEAYVLTLSRSVMRHTKVTQAAGDANVTLTRPSSFLRMMTGGVGASIC